MLSICGEITLCDVSSCLETSVFLILYKVSSFFVLNLLLKCFFFFFFFGNFGCFFFFYFLLEPLVVYLFIYFYRNHGWAAFLSYYWLETWVWEVGSVRVVGKFYFIYHFNLISLFEEYE